MQRIALVGFPEPSLTGEVLDALNSLGYESSSFPAAKLRSAAEFVTTKVDGKLTGTGNIVLACHEVPQDVANKFTRLTKVGVSVVNDADTPTDLFDEQTLSEWVSTGRWTEPELPQDDDDSWLDELDLGDDIEDTEEDVADEDDLADFVGVEEEGTDYSSTTEDDPFGDDPFDDPAPVRQERPAPARPAPPARPRREAIIDDEEDDPFDAPAPVRRTPARASAPVDVEDDPFGDDPFDAPAPVRQERPAPARPRREDGARPSSLRGNTQRGRERAPQPQAPIEDDPFDAPAPVRQERPDRPRRALEADEASATVAPPKERVRPPRPRSARDGLRPTRERAPQPQAPIEDDPFDAPAPVRQERPDRPRRALEADAYEERSEQGPKRGIGRRNELLAEPEVYGGIDDDFNPYSKDDVEAMPAHVRMLDSGVMEGDDEPARSKDVAPYIRNLKPEDRRLQTSTEEFLREYGASPVDSFVRREGRCFYFTGSHGGAGKTTCAYGAANVMAAALRDSEDPADKEREVWLIESDYANPKLQNRFDLEPGHDSGALASFLQRLAKTSSSAASHELVEAKRRTIETRCVQAVGNLRVVVCPYDLSTRETRFIKMAIEHIVAHARDRGAYIFIDAANIGPDDSLHLTLAGMSESIVLVTDTSHLDDMRRARAVITQPPPKGMGISDERISVFFNKTGAAKFKESEAAIHPHHALGFMPYIPALEEKWIGKMGPEDEHFGAMIRQFAMSMTNIAPIPALQRLTQHRVVANAAPSTGLWGRLRKLVRR